MSNLDKIIVSPEEVRGKGNILSSKTSSDYNVCTSELTTETDTVSGISTSVLTLSYYSGDCSNLSLSGNHWVSFDDNLESFTISATLKDGSTQGTGSAISNATLTCIINDDTTLTGTTTSGVCTFTIPTTQYGTTRYNIRVCYEGTNSRKGCSAHMTVNVGEITKINLYTTNNIGLYSSVDETASTLASDWYNISDSANTVTIDSSGILIETDDTYTGSYMQIFPNSLWNIFKSPVMVIEADIISVDNFDITAAINKSDATTVWVHTGERTGHITITVTNKGYEIKQDGVVVDNDSLSINSCRFYFESKKELGDGSIKFKNLEVYQQYDTPNNIIESGSQYKLISQAIGSNNFGEIGAGEGLPIDFVQNCFDLSTEYESGLGSTTASFNQVDNKIVWDNSEHWIFSCEIKVTGIGQRVDICPVSENGNHHLGIGKNTSNRLTVYVGKATSGENSTTYQIFDDNVYYPISIERNGSTVKFYFNNELIQTTNNVSWLSNYADETVKFTQWRANQMSVRNISVKRIVGTEDTNIQGFAQKTLTANGGGKLVFNANNGDVSSQDVIIYDCLLYDNGITQNTKSFVFNSSSISQEINDDGTLVRNISTGGKSYAANKTGTSTSDLYDFTTPFTVEFDVIDLEGSISIQLLGSTSGNIGKYLHDLGGSGTHIKITYDGQSAKYYTNNNDDPIATTTSSLVGNVQVRWMIFESAWFKYRNFMIYQGVD